MKSKKYKAATNAPNVSQLLKTIYASTACAAACWPASWEEAIAQFFSGPCRPAAARVSHHRPRPNLAFAGTHCPTGRGEQTAERQGRNVAGGGEKIIGFWIVWCYVLHLTNSNENCMAHMCGIAAIKF